MSVYKRGGTWWYKFRFEGQAIRESAKTSSKTVARDAERARRRDLELGFNGLAKHERPLFPVAAKDWFGTKSLSPLGSRYYRQYIAKLSRHFGNRLISDITADDIAELQRKRRSQGLSGRQINAEVGTLRAILRYYGRWAHISGRVKMLPQRSDVGRALSREDEARLLEAIGQSRSPSLYPFFILSLDSGLRPSETRSLRWSNLRLTWRDRAIFEGEIIVGRSKTEAGAGRAVPLTRRACAALTFWLARFPQASADTFVFPFHRIAIAGNERIPHLYDVKLDRPMSPSSYRTAFETARRKAEIRFRFYDARHTFVTRLAENPDVSEETIRQLAGHVSPRMLGRYAHIRAQARRTAIATLEPAGDGVKADFDGHGAQNWAQYADRQKTLPN
ncbi:MAG: tyrosine-type recombinase/integrase [Candidatus Binataceae bacterium]